MVPTLAVVRVRKGRLEPKRLRNMMGGRMDGWMDGCEEARLFSSKTSSEQLSLKTRSNNYSKVIKE
eukprot:7635515-Heterocapsa_arctica.AAC.1